MNPTPEQQACIDATEPNIIAIAGPGSGKTATLVLRLLRLVQDGVRPHQILCMTFTTAAALEIQSRLRAAGMTQALGHLGTLHSFCLRRVQQHSQALGFSGKITMLDEAGATELMEQAIRENGARCTVAALREAIPAACRGERASRQNEIAAAHYVRKLRSGGMVDFEAALQFGLQAMALHPAVEHLVVDEAQDSGPLDWAIYDAVPATNRFYVGDPDQSIYGFRGAEMKLLLERANSGKFRILGMNHNFRSVPAVCCAANRLIENNRLRVPKQIVPSRPEMPIPAVVVQEFETDAQEIAAILERVGKMLKSARGIQPNEIAILCRTNAVANDFRKEARDRGMPVAKTFKSTRPMDWQIAIAAVQLLQQPGSLTAYFRFVTRRDGSRSSQAAQRTAAIEQSASVPADVPKNATAGNVGECLARMDVSPESIQEVLRIRDGLIDPDLLEITSGMMQEPEEQTGEGLHIGTIHSAKGREWRYVFGPAWEQQQFPGNTLKRDLEEERRLAFVLITRARDQLLLSGARMRRFGFGARQLTAASPSVFLSEIK